jgi:hypothetical protein
MKQKAETKRQEIAKTTQQLEEVLPSPLLPPLSPLFLYSCLPLSPPLPLSSSSLSPLSPTPYSLSPSLLPLMLIKL